MFHHTAVTGVGSLGFLVTWYLLKAARQNKGTHVELQLAMGEKPSSSTLTEFVAKLLVSAALDKLTSHIIPIALYGTKTLEMWPDMIIKKFCNLSLLCMLMNSQQFESFMQR